MVWGFKPPNRKAKSASKGYLSFVDFNFSLLFTGREIQVGSQNQKTRSCSLQYPDLNSTLSSNMKCIQAKHITRLSLSCCDWPGEDVSHKRHLQTHKTPACTGNCLILSTDFGRAFIPNLAECKADCKPRSKYAASLKGMGRLIARRLDLWGNLELVSPSPSKTYKSTDMV